MYKRAPTIIRKIVAKNARNEFEDIARTAIPIPQITLIIHPPIWKNSFSVKNNPP
jgi:hypothetical protein